ncbi:2-C-methyl-D-erythritol 2,4-cyclodiphosphate synthase [Macrococcoides canis]|uniref:2-C-methyl-D-erythritol 2,4-cyclodiphosphate synthase n=1 Tax=Macrococcoides canis TaxID=1855823 RepID=A0A4R6C496_9STAP|nr:2-C-methyl-D-erythritol 2,4-cyclodiphosphate synthase [Macrococcus canis]MEE1108019.1 2-C-methyl-D-erythritol 2,4-cyclodiphosphate synthase [Macrococcus canis]TDM16428.1 2-C-methyl-D-erythritol 2,4-cyclodiphosphate synthase [Macrococcus canis]TDM19871.1 2-C-methyl-D-erythritol 2,4-cyclodiphosphate synthase [Macrococcus canis]TDM22083.1 2-C-methyl-D-erythritol 2,4-cyclodiphosphate synthase [Macrococcus canis]TDM29720.1 2-C-methyl-D-erythritol 2,4-cyclodiphosphate synthase [Macrococcus canis]
MMRIGYGYDVHQLVEGRPLIIGGIELEHDKGLLGHSDADVLLHAITDAILGAVSLGDIGKFFPDDDPKYKGADSKILLKDAYQHVLELGYEIGNLDATIIAEKPKFRPHIDAMRETISNILNTDIFNVNVKATTNEKMGYLGRQEGIQAQAVVLLLKTN